MWLNVGKESVWKKERNLCANRISSWDHGLKGTGFIPGISLGFQPFSMT